MRGKPNKKTAIELHREEHPRVCGENSRNPPPPLPMRGTSPRMRENLWPPGVRHTGGGTSPRMRGKPAYLLLRRKSWRNIPAYAGKTLHNRSICRGCSEHPRVCGENELLAREVGTYCGTSPRMRGKRTPLFRINPQQRNIPAYAGKTWRGRCSCHCRTEHPRVCGENHHSPVPSVLPPGTSPRMRGKRLGCVAHMMCKTEHPRVCGENRVETPTAALGWGTSPRMRENTDHSTDPEYEIGTSPRMRGKRATQGC